MSNSKDEPKLKESEAPIAAASATAVKKAALRKSLRIVGPLTIADDVLEKLESQGRSPKWVNDKLSRIAQHQQMGYEFVTNSEGQKVSEVVYFNGQHKGLVAYLMSISHDDRAMLRAEKEKDVNDTEAEIHAKAKDSLPGKGGLFNVS